jgi:SAM-dependent methyltransferase
MRNERGEWVAFVVPSDSYLDDVLGRKEAQALALKRWQKSFDLTQFTKNAKSNPVGFNTQGWNSSYTGKEIPPDEMHEWVQVTASSILELAPRAVYEIGCGTGMLLMQIASSCDRYLAADFSTATLTRLREQLRSIADLEALVQVVERSADNFEGLDRQSFDTIVINSAAQYFPSLAYLTQVIKGAISLLTPGGRIFFGDVQSFHLLPLFASSVELFRAPDELSASALCERVRRRLRLEPWLYISPAFFLSLVNQFPEVSRVEIRPRLGRADNEVTRYRFNATVHIGPTAAPSYEIQFEDWRDQEIDLDTLRKMLEQRTEAFGIKCIANSRIRKDLCILERLVASDTEMNAGELKRERELADTRGLHPQDIVDLSVSLDFRVNLSWAASRADGSYDAVFIPMHSSPEVSSPSINWPKPDPSEFIRLATRPGQGKITADLVFRILEQCNRQLPHGLSLREVTLVDMLPNEHGVIDASALLRPRPWEEINLAN